MPTNIEWTGESWNPIRARLRSDPARTGWHCEHVSPGCEHCYAETQNRAQRFDLGTGLAYKPGHRKDVEVYLDQAALLKPLGWRKPRTIFVCSMTDLFGDFVDDHMIDRVFAVMALCPQHTFQVLTKRSARMREFFQESTGWRARIAELLDELKPSPLWNGNVYQGWQDLHGRPDGLPNVWLGVSVEDQQRADERIPDLLATPAAIRWISAEPLLGPVQIAEYLPNELWNDLPSWKQPELDWVVVGGESGKAARPMHPDWARRLRDQCAAAAVPFFFKQWGEWAPRHSWGERRMVAIDAKGNKVPDDVVPQDVGGHRFARLGKKRAGRLLDGVQHDGMPGQ